jgi:hypothetical protein
MLQGKTEIQKYNPEPYGDPNTEGQLHLAVGLEILR